MLPLKGLKSIISEHAHETIILLWLVVSQLLMQMLKSGIFFNEAQAMASALEPYIPTLRRMDHDLLFDIPTAKAQASIMLALVPLMAISYFTIQPQNVFASVRAKGVGNGVALMIFLLVLVIAYLFVGFNVRGPGRVFEKSPYGFAILSGGACLFYAYYIRALVAIFLKK